MDIVERRSFPHRILQPLEGFIEAQHSTATFTREAMGEALAADYDAELEALLLPCADAGLVELRYASVLTLGRPRKTPRPA
jgi:hypothetical protein